MAESNRSERAIDVADIYPQYGRDPFAPVRSTWLRAHSLQIVADHDHRRLRLEFEVRHGSRCGRSYLEGDRTSGAFGNDLNE